MQRGGEERSQGRKEEEELVEKRGSRWIKRRSEASEQDLGSCHLLHDLRENAVHMASLSVRIFPQGLGSKSREGVTGLLWGHPSAPTSVQPCGSLSHSYPWKLLAVGTSLFQQRPPDRDIVMTSLKITVRLSFL